MDKGFCTNQAESYCSRLRRMKVGTHHHITGKYIAAYSGAVEWREDHRRVDNDQRAVIVGAALMAGVWRRQLQLGWYGQRAA
jgi:ISXO2-like transposase domain